MCLKSQLVEFVNRFLLKRVSKEVRNNPP